MAFNVLFSSLEIFIFEERMVHFFHAEMKIKGKNGTESARVFGTVTRMRLLGGDSSEEQKEARQLPEQRERSPEAGTCVHTCGDAPASGFGPVRSLWGCFLHPLGAWQLQVARSPSSLPQGLWGACFSLPLWPQELPWAGSAGWVGATPASSSSGSAQALPTAQQCCSSA